MSDVLVTVLLALGVTTLPVLRGHRVAGTGIRAAGAGLGVGVGWLIGRRRARDHAAPPLGLRR